jgi:hypothetical protein
VPEPWRDDLGGPDGDFVPLVEDPGYQGWPGWVSYENTILDGPEVEVISGGLNSKTPEGAAVWRQGHLMHFGFEESPEQMNDTGRDLLVNAIAYIARFTEDRPIVRAPSPFAGVSSRSRGSLEAWLGNEDYPVTWFTACFAKGTLLGTDVESREALQAWYEENRHLLRPDEQGQLVVDDDLRSLGAAYDELPGLTAIVEALGNDATRKAARRVLDRCVPEGPDSVDADAWRAWLDGHRPYMFFSEWGGYRWYVDPLAKRRGVPTSELRGSDRADADVTALSSSVNGPPRGPG